MRVLLFALCLSTLCSCSMFSKHSSITDLTALDADKKALLQPRVEKFNREVYWGVISEAASYTEPGARVSFRELAKNRRRNEKIVDQSIEDMEIDVENNTALVHLRTRFFSKNGSLYVQERLEQQRWNFHRVDGGWLYAGTEEMPISESESGGSLGMFSNTSRRR